MITEYNVPGKGKGPVVEGFVPRKEFTREQRQTSSFSLLAVSGAGHIRLYSFTPETIEAIRNLLDRLKLIIAFREVVGSNLCEFTIDGKPWSNPKSMTSEALLLYIISAIYDHGWQFLSTIDYGRDPDDRVAIAFSKPSPASATASPISPLHFSQVPPGYRKVPFAVSFQSATTMRVINPPLSSTPAILQAVRGAWPRGVASEKKVGDGTYVFKLKGYKWYQEDTFAADSLRYILSLLDTLDQHAFTLLASICLTSRSRVKDLWIFTGLVPIAEYSLRTPELPQSTSEPSSPQPTETSLPAYDEMQPFLQDSVRRHTKQASAPTNTFDSLHPIASMHSRAATSPQNFSARSDPSPQPQSRQVLGASNKPAHAVAPPPMRSPYPPAPRSDTVFSSNIAGIGSGGVLLQQPTATSHPSVAPAIHVDVPPAHTGMPSASGSGFTLHHSPESTETLHGPATLNFHSQPTQDSPPSPVAPSWVETPEPDLPQGLLGGAFQGDIDRDSFTSTLTDDSDFSRVIPVNWVGPGVEPQASELLGPDQTLVTDPGHLSRASSIGPQLPGGWLDSPVDEHKPQEVTDIAASHNAIDAALRSPKLVVNEIRDVDDRVSAAHFQVHEGDVRPLSESGMIGTTTPTRLSTIRQKTPETTTKKLVKREASGHGWVVLDSDAPAVEFPSSDNGPATTPSKKPFELLSGSKIKLDPKSNNETGSGGIKQLLSFSKKPAGSTETTGQSHPANEGVTEDGTLLDADANNNSSGTKASRSRFRDRFRVGSNAEANKGKSSKG